MIKKNKVSVTKISVQWGEMDAFNHVNNVMYIRWCETARISLFREISVSYTHLTLPTTFGV